MSKRKHLEKLVRRVAHQGVQLGAFDQRLLILSVLGSAEREDLVAILRQSQVAAYAKSLRDLDQHGVEHAIATVLLGLAEQVYGDSASSFLDPSPLRELYAWHDWDSFLIDLHIWVLGVRSALTREIARRAAGGEISKAAELALREILAWPPAKTAPS